MEQFWKQFKSGTDIRGVAVDGVEGEPLNLTDEVVEKIAGAFVVWISNKLSKNANELKISVGHDSRISANRISQAVQKSLSVSGVKIVDCGLSSTPSMFMTTVKIGCDGAIQITASHHPYHRNGLKFFTREGGLDGSDIEQILLFAQDGVIPPSTEAIVAEKLDFMAIYSEMLREMVCSQVNSENYEKPLDGYKIVVDAGNGAGGFYAYQVLQPLGADISGSCFLEPDGYFPNHIPNPEDATAMKSISNATLSSNADLGVIFDTEVDRGGCVDRSGGEINRNRLVALAAAIALEGENKGGTIVTDSITSDGLKKFIENDLGGIHRRFKRGYKNVINESLRINQSGINSPLAIETSGHAAFKENYFLDDGAYLVTKIIIKMAQLGKEGKKLDDLVASLEESVEDIEVRMKINEREFKKCGETIISNLLDYAKQQSDWNVADDSCEGVRVSFGKDNGEGWFLLRLSVHDPIMPLNIESNVVGGTKIIANKLLNFMKTCDGIEIQNLENACK